MPEFTYSIPDEKKFLSAILQILSRSSNEKEIQLAGKLKGGTCTIASSNQYSGERWNAYSTTVHFYVPIENLDFFDREAIKILIRVANRVMPKQAGYDIQNVEIGPLLDQIATEGTLTADLEEIQGGDLKNIIQLLPEDIKQKGKEMSEVYVYLYCVENSLRLFVDQVCSVKEGENYWENIVIPSGVKKSIQVRKESEAKNQWMGLRGNSDLFYLDFKEIGTLITNNWDLFKMYFPDQQWLSVKIEELANCRNLIAHNSYISSLERDVIRLNYNQVLKQIASVEKKKAAERKEPNSTDDLPF